MESGIYNNINNIREAAEFIVLRSSIEPEIGIILGTGLGKLVNEIDIDIAIPYSEIPYFPLSTVETHDGVLILGRLSGKPVITMQGRFHYYEGYSMQQIVFPVRVMKLLGVKTVLISNACGSINPQFELGSLMLIEDHINLLGDNPLRGKNIDELGNRFPDMSEPYSHSLLAKAGRIAMRNNIELNSGIYAAMTGPSLETRAEYRMLRTLGADVVGMSTVPETIAAVHCGMEVFGLSVVTDVCDPDTLKPINVNEVYEIARKSEPTMTKIFKLLIEKL